MAIAIVLVVVVVGSVAFHLLSPWWWTPIASNWSYIDHTISITFWITGIVFAAVVLFMAASSFLADTFNVADRLVPQNERDYTIRLFGVEIVIAAIGFLIFGIMLWQARKLINRRTRKD